MSPVSPSPNPDVLKAIPSVDRVLNWAEVRELAAQHGKSLVTRAAREVLAELRTQALEGTLDARETDEASVRRRVARRMAELSRPRLRPVFNLPGTVLHTNLGRTLLPDEAIEAVAQAMAWPANLEYDL